MKLTRWGSVLIAGAVVAALAACSQGSAGDGAGADGADGGAGGVDESAPLYDSLPQAIKDAGEIVVAGDTHPPYRTIEEDGSVTGLDPDIQTALSEQLGVPFRIEVTSGLDAMLTGMLSGRYDGFNGPIRTTEEREQDFDAVVWMTTQTSYLYLAENADELSDPTALCGARVAGVEGSTTESQLEHYTEWCDGEGLPAPEFLGFADTNSTVLAVQSDRADYAGTTQTAAIDLQFANPDEFEYLVQSEEQGAGIDQLAFFFPKGNELAPVVLEAFSGIFESGEYDRIMEEWGVADVTVDEPTLNPMTSA
ncbi:MAG: transporter substrate-binding domain-containing protein [Pseudoclavibacter sp.]